VDLRLRLGWGADIIHGGHEVQGWQIEPEETGILEYIDVIPPNPLARALDQRQLLYLLWQREDAWVLHREHADRRVAEHVGHHAAAGQTWIVDDGARSGRQGARVVEQPRQHQQRSVSTLSGSPVRCSGAQAPGGALGGRERRELARLTP
jgi:hypothetical protein